MTTYIDISQSIIIALQAEGVKPESSWVRTCHSNTCCCASHDPGYSAYEVDEDWMEKNAVFHHGTPSTFESWSLRNDHPIAIRIRKVMLKAEHDWYGVQGYELRSYERLVELESLTKDLPITLAQWEERQSKGWQTFPFAWAKETALCLI